MWKVAAIAAAAALTLAFPAHAEKHCDKLAKVEKSFGPDGVLTPMSRAQYFVLVGMYLRDPSTPEGLPPGDGAAILSSQDGSAGLILWISGPIACDPWPISEAAKLLALLAKITDDEL